MSQDSIWKSLSTKQTIVGICVGVSFTITASFLLKKILKKSDANRDKSRKVVIVDLIGQTPLIYLPKLSSALNCQIYAKVQYLNPFGSSKDRAVKHMLQKILQKAKQNGQQIKQVVQASSGSTAISLVQISKIYNLKVTIFLPDDLAEDKYTYLQTIGAKIIKVPQVSIVDPSHFFNMAKDYAKKHNACFLNQFDNLDNMQVHYKQTGPQIYRQMCYEIDAFVCSAGTGGTIAGVSKYLKEVTKGKTKIILADPQGSGLHSKIKYNTLFTIQQKEGHRLKNPFDTVIEGVGLNRPTRNFQSSIIDDSYKIKDVEALHMSNYLIQNQGLFVGGSCALNIAAVVKYCRKNPNSRVVTVLHDSGNRYLKKFYNSTYLKQKKIKFQKYQEYQQNQLKFIQ